MGKVIQGRFEAVEDQDTGELVFEVPLDFQIDRLIWQTYKHVDRVRRPTEHEAFKEIRRKVIAISKAWSKTEILFYQVFEWAGLEHTDLGQKKHLEIAAHAVKLYWYQAGIPVYDYGQLNAMSIELNDRFNRNPVIPRMHKSDYEKLYSRWAATQKPEQYKHLNWAMRFKEPFGDAA